MRSRTSRSRSKRPPVVPDIMNLPATFNVAIAFDVDTPIIQPDSYETVGRIADAMVNAPLLPYTFLIVGHTESNGNRQANVILSQRRADAIRDVLANTFKISVQTPASLGVGEEQFIDQAHPTSAVNQQIQIVTMGKVPDTEAAAARACDACCQEAREEKEITSIPSSQERRLRRVSKDEALAWASWSRRCFHARMRIGQRRRIISLKNK